MRRRDIIALLGGAAAAASPLPLLAQQAGRTVRVGMLETVSTALKPDDLAAFRQGLRALGYVEGQNLRIEYRSADGRPERFPALAQELIGLNVDVITTRAIGITSQLFDVRKTADLAPAFENASRQQVGAFVVNIDAVTQENQKLIIELAAQHRLPAIYPSREFVNAGGLITYGVNYPDLYRRAATYVDKILKGTKPGDLPVEQPTKFETVVNLKTAKVLSLALPPAILLRADEVIE